MSPSGDRENYYLAREYHVSIMLLIIFPFSINYKNDKNIKNKNMMLKDKYIK